MSEISFLLFPEKILPNLMKTMDCILPDFKRFIDARGFFSRFPPC